MTRLQTFAPTVMARCPACHRALAPGNSRTHIEVRLIEAHEEPRDGALVMECPRPRCRRKIEVRPVVQSVAA